MKRVARALFGLLALAVIAIVLGAVVPRPLWTDGKPAESSVRRILVLSNQIHTDIAIPVDAEVRRRFDFLATAGIPVDLPGVRYILFGWGGRDFYISTPTWSELKIVPLLKGMTMDASVMHVEVIGAVDEPQPNVLGVDISESQFQALQDFIEASFQHVDDGPVPIPGAAYGQYDGFFEANGTFTALLGCNTWTAKALRAAGIRTGWWTPLPPLLRLSIRMHN